MAVPIRPERFHSEARVARDLTAEQRTIQIASRQQLRVALTDASGATVSLSGAELARALVAPPPHDFATRFPTTERAELLAALDEANQRNARGAHIDLTTHPPRAQVAPAADGVEAVPQAAADKRMRAGTSGVDGAFTASPRALEVEDYTFWDRLLDVLKEIFTLGFADTRLDGSIDKEVWQNNAATLAMSGGAELRNAFLAMKPERARNYLTELVQRANPNIASAEAASVGAALATELRAIYANPAIAGQPPQAQQADARLSALRSTYLRSKGAFGDNPGAWLHAQLRSTEPVAEAIRGPQSAVATEALLLVRVPAFIELDARSRSELAAMVHHNRTQATSESLVHLVNNPAFRGFTNTVRRGLIESLRNQGFSAQNVASIQHAATALGGASAPVQARATEVLRSVPAKSSAYGTTVELLGSPAFLALPGERQLQVLAHVAHLGGDGEATRAMSELVSSQHFASLDMTVANTLLDAAAASGSSATRQTIHGLLEAPGFARLSAAEQNQALLAMHSIERSTLPPSANTAVVRAARRAALLAVINSEGFLALPGAQQNALLSRFAEDTKSSSSIQDSFAPVAGALDALLVGPPQRRRLGLTDPNLGTVLGYLISARGVELAQRAEALKTSLAGLSASGLSVKEQGDVLHALARGSFSSTRAQALAALLADSSFTQKNRHPRLAGSSRSLLLRHMASANSGRFDTLVELAKDDDLARLNSANEHTVIELAATWDAATTRELRRLIGAAEFRNPGVENLDGSARNAYQTKLLEIVARTRPSRIGVDGLRAMRDGLHDERVQQLASDHQLLVLAHIGQHPGAGAEIRAMLAGYDSVPNNLHDTYVRIVTETTQPSVMRDFTRMAESLAGLPEETLLAIFRQSRGGGAFYSIAAARLAEPTFRNAGPGAQHVAVLGMRVEAEEHQQGAHLLGNTRFLALPLAERATMLEGILAAPAADRALLLREWNELLASQRFASLSQSQQTRLMGCINSIKIGDRTAILASFQRLLSDANVNALGANTQLTLMSHALNYPNVTAIDNLRRLSAAPWFISMSLADQQRSALMVAFASNEAHHGSAIQRRIIGNTLGQFLPPHGTLRVRWNTFNNAPGETTLGHSAGRVLELNASIMAASNSSIAPSSIKAAKGLLVDTVAHEVTHLMNADESRDGWGKFIGEYRAWYVGQLARSKKPPTRAQAWARIQDLLNASGYSYLATATRDRDRSVWEWLAGADGRPTAEAQRIISFCGKFYAAPRRPSPLDPRSANIVINGRSHMPPHPDGPAPEPDPRGNLDNSGTPPA